MTAMNEAMPQPRPISENSNRYVSHHDAPQQIFDHSIPIIKHASYTTPTSPAAIFPSHYVIQLDGGANRSITNNAALLINFKNIKRYAMSGIGNTDPALYCTGKGLLPWQAETGETLLVSCYYSHQASETLISPTDVVLNHIGTYKAWGQHADLDTGTGAITFYNRNGVNHARYPLFMRNGLWFYSPDPPLSNPRENFNRPIINRLTAIMLYVLMHERLNHPGKRKMSIIHLHFIDMPRLTTRNIELYPCSSCAEQHNRQETERRVLQPATAESPNPSAQPLAFETYDDDPTETPHTVTHADSLPDYIQKQLECLPVNDCRFHMDFGFPRGSTFKGTDVDTGHTYTSIDGYRAYLIIILYPQRRIWIFLVKNKRPPIEILRKFLRRYDIKDNSMRVIRTDQGGELWKSHAFKQLCCDDFQYFLEPTAPGAPNQNGMVERPNQTLAKMTRCALHSAGLGPQFWSFAILHAVYIYNRLPHSVTGVSPYTAYTGTLPTAKYLRIFGSRVIVRRPGERNAKLDNHTNAGIFLGYTATDKNIIYMDALTQEIKTANHVIFDEAHMTAPRSKAPPAATILQHLGFHNDAVNGALPPVEVPPCDALLPHHPASANTSIAQIVLLTPNATTPTRGTANSVGYDLFSAADVTIEPQSRTKVPTDVAITPPPGYFGQLLSRSGLAANKNIDCLAGVIDPDYTGNINVLLQNSGKTPYYIHKGDRIAQLVFLKIDTPTLEVVPTLETTDRASNGFGSTDNPPKETTANNAIINNLSPAAASNVTPDAVTMPFDIILSNEPFDHYINVTIDTWGDHPTLGLILDDSGPHILLKAMERSTPGHRVPRFKSTLIKATPVRVANTDPNLDAYVTCISDLEQLVQAHRQNNIKSMTITFGTITPIPLHIQTGNPQIHQDQLNAVQKVLYQLRREKRDNLPSTNAATIAHAQESNDDDTGVHGPRYQQQHQPEFLDNPPDFTPVLDADPELSQKFTLKQLKQRSDWPEWRQSQFKQLQQYADQQMFGDPEPLPPDANALYLLWTYVLKVNGTKKARCVCNGSRNRGAVTMGHIFANALSPNAERLFWAIVAKEGLTAIGADVSNAFAEAPPPHQPFYVYVDDTFRDWWENELKRPPIPKGYVLRVNHALQGHPESPRLWERHIDTILRKLKFTPTTHDPCLYNYNANGKRILFLRQVDDFSIAARDPQDAHDIIAQINAELSIPVKDQGLIEWYNGIDIEQTKYYVRLHATTYFHKMLQNHGWFNPETIPSDSPVLPIPMSGDNEYIRKLDLATPPTDQADKNRLQDEYGFKYRQVIGEVLYPMVKCRPDISTSIIKLSQYMSNPAREHYQAVQQLVKYISQTYTEGIIYWREHTCDHHPDKGIPTLHQDNYTLQKTAPDAGNNLYGYSDSDWGADSNHRRSITGIIIMYAGGAIGYKTKYQDTIALSSTEAEFVAACDTAKLILYFRSLLDDLGIPQREATVIYEDNRGALMMVEAQQPTKNSRHIDIKHYAILDWVERDLLTLQDISTHDNASDGMTKPLAKQLFYRHFDTYMGRRVPPYFRTKFSHLFSAT
mmetsp:Transcript_14552/g.20797  ORF Transcript_14552/g.20797 Transcript_14552/m.20797 type:complete len:1557 (+) Transcript_14552:1335-6005(+)